jgi:DNA-binding transcriptional LysR family regulator
MDLRHLRYFIFVAEEMHFGRAAARLGISQPPLSQQIRALEAELGTDLFDRTSRRVALTEAGRLLLPEARQTIAQADRAMRTVRRVRSGEVGRLALGFTTSGPFVPDIAKALYAFRRGYPDIELELNELGRDEQVAGIEEGRLDLGMIRSFDEPVLPAGIVSRLLLSEDVLLAMSKDHWLAAESGPLSLGLLADEDFVLYNRANGAGFNEHFVALCARAEFVPRVVQEASSLATLLGLISAGFGMTPLSRSLTRLYPDEITCRTIAGEGLASRLWLVHRETVSPAAANFIACIGAP